MLLEASKDWTIHTFSDLVKESQLGTILRGSESNNLTPLVKMGNLEWGGLNLRKLEQLDNDYVEEHLLLEKGDFLFNTRNTLELVGKSTTWPDNTRATFDNNINRIRFKDSVDPFFMELFLNHGKGKQAINRLAVGSTSVAAVYWKDVAKLKLTLPTFSEQQEIVKIISAWNQLIFKAQNLIEAKQKQKKALMQRLLTGKHRFPEFEGQEWTKLKADKIFKSYSKKNNPNEPLLAVMQDMGVVPRDMLDRRVAMPEGSTDGYKLIEPGDFVISLRSFQGGLEYSRYRGIVSPAYTILKSIRPINDDFYRHYFKSYEFIGRLSVAVIGIRDGKQISYDDFSFMELPSPSIEEQQKIAAVLNAADKEIDLLAQKLEAYQEQKKGLMQQLLTGKKRVNLTRKEAA